MRTYTSKALAIAERSTVYTLARLVGIGRGGTYAVMEAVFATTDADAQPQGLTYSNALR